MTTNKRISELLRRNNLKLSCAESFTGGGIASALVSVVGASDIFSSSLICYSNEAKIKLLDVNKKTIEDYGAVSEQTVSEMLDGLNKLGLGNVFIATSANAGPTSEKPNEVGIFYLGAMFKEKKIINKYFFSGDRNQVIEYGIEKSFELIEKIIEQN